jgi:2-dehydropantoate 2-reductase
MAMRILVVGAGATGGYFGGRLAQAGRDVTFLVRPGRAAQLRAGGLQIVSPHGDVTLTPQLVTTGEKLAAYDVVLLAVKAFALEPAIEDFAPAVGAGTMIVPLLNGMRHVGMLTGRFGERPVLGGLCLIATTLDERGRVVQMGESHDLTYGERSGERTERVAALDALMQGAGFDAHLSTRVVEQMWEKWIALATLGGITCLMRGTVGDVAAVPYGTDFASALLDECVVTVIAAGYAPDLDFVARTRAAMTRAGSPVASSMYRDLQNGNDVEADQILGDLVAQARGFGLATPLLAAAYTNLKVYQAARR